MDDDGNPMSVDQEERLISMGLKPRADMSFSEAQELLVRYQGMKISRGNIDRSWDWLRVLGMLAFAGLIVWGYVAWLDSRGGEKPAKKKAVVDTATQIRVGIRVWCASNLADPDYEIVEWGGYKREGHWYAARAKIRAKNAFNAHVLEWKTFWLSAEFDVMSVE